MSKPRPATHVFILRAYRRQPLKDPEAYMAGTIEAQEAAIEALWRHGFAHSTGMVQLGSMEDSAAKLGRIAEAHSKHAGPAGMTSGDCVECGWSWPCPTYLWATEDLDPLAPWRPE